MIHKNNFTINRKCIILMHMVKKVLLGILLLGCVGLVVAAIADFLYMDQQINSGDGFLSPIIEQAENLTAAVSPPQTDLADDNVINVLLLGIDRRSRAEAGYRTDIMILVSVNTETNRVVLTSIPRDLWYGSGRLNATYIAEGWEGMQSAIEEITGHKPERFILTDFADFAWVIDALGGVDVVVETAFTDHEYPNDVTNTPMTISFTAGPQHLDGANALIYSRSRKGDFDNGDWGRMARQHIVLKSLVNAIAQPTSFICGLTKNTPFAQGGCAEAIDKNTIEQALKTVTTGKMETNLAVEDLVYLWDFYKDKDLYTIESLFLNHDYLFTPPMAEYGGAWVLAPIGDSYTTFQTDLQNLLTGIAPSAEPSEPVLENQTTDPTPELPATN